VKHFDQGIDYQGNPGQNVVAIGDAVVDAVKPNPGGFGWAVYYTLTDGPHKGQQIYVGHARPANLRPGQKLAAGDTVATLQKVSGGNAHALVGWVEIGLAKNGAPQFSHDQGGPMFSQFLVGAAKTPDTAAGAVAPVTSAVSAPVDTSQQQLAPPSLGTPVGAADPSVEMPGTAQHYLPGSGTVADSWQSIAALPNLSPDTQRLIALSSGG
jgi:hypothetical protein